MPVLLGLRASSLWGTDADAEKRQRGAAAKRRSEESTPRTKRLSNDGRLRAGVYLHPTLRMRTVFRCALRASSPCSPVPLQWLWRRPRTAPPHTCPQSLAFCRNRKARSSLTAGADTGAHNMNAPIVPDARLTPGAVLAVTVQDIAVPDYTKKVRDVPQAVKEEVYPQLLAGRPHKHCPTFKGEGQTSEVEGVNNALRQRVSYLVRRGAASARSEPVFTRQQSPLCPLLNELRV